MAKKSQHPFPNGPPAHVGFYEAYDSHKVVVEGGGYRVEINRDELEQHMRNSGRRLIAPRIGEAALPYKDLFMAALDPGWKAAWAKVIQRPQRPFRKRLLITVRAQRKRYREIRVANNHRQLG